MCINYLAIKARNVKFGIDKGIEICLQPLNSILHEKTNSDPPPKSAYITMEGEGVTTYSVKLAHTKEELLSGDMKFLMGHAESLLSSKGETMKLVLW